jgi:hypothetical protein
LLERWGTRVMRRGLVRSAPDADDGVHVLSDRERAAIRRIARAAIVRASIAGAVAGLLCAAAATLATPLLGPMPDDATLAQEIRYRAVTLGAVALISALEIAFLYLDALRTVRDLANAAGLRAPPKSGLPHDPSVALARAALEFPNPLDELPGVEPLRESSRAVFVLLSIVYKVKVAATGFIVRAIVRRLLGRLATRLVLELVAVPVTAAWDAIACWAVVREAKLRVMGPSAAEEMVDAILADDELVAGGAPPDGTADLLARAVGSAIVRSRDLHPNLVALLAKLERTCPGADLTVIDDSEAFLGRLGASSAPLRRAGLRMLVAAAIMDGRVGRRERAFLSRAAGVAGFDVSLAHVEALRVAFLRGTAGIAREILASVRAPSAA